MGKKSTEDVYHTKFYSSQTCLGLQDDFGVLKNYLEI